MRAQRAQNRGKLGLDSFFRQIGCIAAAKQLNRSSHRQPVGHLIAEIRVADGAVQNPAYILGKQNIF
jgi:hypothetical protein